MNAMTQELFLPRVFSILCTPQPVPETRLEAKTPWEPLETAAGGGKGMRIFFLIHSYLQVIFFELRPAGATQNHSLLMQKLIKNAAQKRC